MSYILQLDLTKGKPGGRLIKIWDKPDYLATWLNEDGDQAGKKRIIFLIEKTQSALSPFDKYALVPIEEAISRYHLAPMISLQALDSGKLDFIYRSLHSNCPQSELEEYAAFDAYVNLVRTGRLMKLRRCSLEECNRWYLAKIEHQRYCKNACKQKQARSTEEFKAKRRNYMREEYHRKKERQAHRQKLRRR